MDCPSSNCPPITPPGRFLFLFIIFLYKRKETKFSYSYAGVQLIFNKPEGLKEYQGGGRKKQWKAEQENGVGT